MKKASLVLMFILSCVELQSAQEPKKTVTQNERELSKAVMLTIVALSDRPAVYAKQALTIERDLVQEQNEDKKRCMQDSVNFFKTLALADKELDIRLAHTLFSDRYAECQKIIFSGNNSKV